MVKPSRGIDPLLRRPFSIFEILRDAGRDADGHLAPQQAHRRRHRLLYDAEPGARVGCLGPLGRPFEPVDPPAEAWMVAGGVGLAPFVTLAEALRRAGTPTRAVLRRAPRVRAVLRRAVRTLGVEPVLATEDGSRGARGLRHGAARRGAGRRCRARSDVQLYACGPTPMMRAVAAARGLARHAVRRLARAGHGLRPRRLLQLRRPRRATAGPARRTSCDRCIDGPGVRRRPASSGTRSTH